MTTARQTPESVGSLATRGGATLMQTYARYPVEIAGGNGCRLVDSHGKSYLDFVAGIAVSVLGHGHPAIVDALHNAIDLPLHVSNLYWTEPMVRLAERLTAASGMDRAFFCNSGTEAIEAGIKLARRSCPGRSKIICFERSFHGRTLGALSVTAQPRYQQPFRPLLPEIVALPFGEFDAVENVVDDTVGLVLVEPIQGEGGVRPAPPEWLQHLRTVCDASGAVLLFDEVQAGVGRTGRFFAYQHEGVLPDAVASAKGLAGGLPMGALLARGRAARAFEPGDHGCTFGGGPFVASVADAVVSEVLSDGFLETVTNRGTALLEGLEEICARQPLVESIRGRGLMLGIVLTSDVASDVVNAALERGLLLCPAGADVVRLVPPLIVSGADISEALTILEAAIESVAAGAGGA
jgi:predicted acetylornithine/succinylornithine family transaminase